MNPEEIIEVLEQIGALLTPAANRVWAAALRYSYLTGWLYTGVGIVLFVVGLVGVRFYREGSGLGSRQGYSHFPDEDKQAIGVLLAPMGFITSLTSLLIGLPYLLAPEFATMKVLLKLLD